MKTQNKSETLEKPKPNRNHINKETVLLENTNDEFINDQASNQPIEINQHTGTLKMHIFCHSECQRFK